MTNWLERAKREISKNSNVSNDSINIGNSENDKIFDSIKDITAITANRDLKSVMTVPKLEEIEITRFSNVSNGSEKNKRTENSYSKRDLISHQTFDFEVHDKHNSPPFPWNTEDDFLIQWFLSATNLPSRPFQLKMGVKVTQPDKFYGSLRTDIDEGSKGPRNLFKSLIADLKCLKNICISEEVLR